MLCNFRLVCCLDIKSFLEIIQILYIFKGFFFLFCFVQTSFEKPWGLGLNSLIVWIFQWMGALKKVTLSSSNSRDYSVCLIVANWHLRI